MKNFQGCVASFDMYTALLMSEAQALRDICNSGRAQHVQSIVSMCSQCTSSDQKLKEATCEQHLAHDAQPAACQHETPSLGS